LNNENFKILSRFSNILSIKIYQKFTNSNIVFPLYHTVSDTPLLHLNQLYNIKNTKEFINDIDFLLKHFSVIYPDKLFETILNKQKITKPSFLLSFDDGLSEIYTIVYPILKQKGIPAIFFVNPYFIDNKGMFYRFKTSLIINYLQENKQLNKLIEIYLKDNHLFYNNIHESLHKISFINSYVLDNISKICNLDFELYLNNQKPYLTKNQIFEMSENGFLIGAHSLNHPNYSELSINEQLLQTTNSVNYIKNEFNQKHKLFAFPFTDYGISKTFFDQIFSKNEKVVDFTFGTAGIKKDIYYNILQRIPFEKQNLSSKKIIKTEYLYYFIKALANKNTIHRN